MALDVLIVDDEADIVNLVRYNLEKENHEVLSRIDVPAWRRRIGCKSCLPKRGGLCN